MIKRILQFFGLVEKDEYGFYMKDGTLFGSLKSKAPEGAIQIGAIQRTPKEGFGRK